jgi:multiple sugar transport system permease protein
MSNGATTAAGTRQYGLQPNGRKRAFRKGLRQWRAVLPFIFIGMLGTAVFVIYPLVKNIMVSFQDYKILPGAHSPWVGLENYKKAFTDEKFYYALRNTFLNTVITVPVNWFLSVFFAVLMNMAFVRLKMAFRFLYYLPIVTDWLVVAFLFRYLFADGPNGMVNFLLLKLHLIHDPVGWLQNQWTAMVVIWLFHIWKTVGWGAIIYLAALQGLPKDLYEAAEIDGAGAVQVFRHITIPLLRPITLFILINLVQGAFNFFPQVYFITRGGLAGKTEVLQSLIYTEAFKYFHFGYAAALSVMMGIAIFAVTWIWQRQIGKENMF